MKNTIPFTPLPAEETAPLTVHEYRDEPTEYELANLLERQLPPALTVGNAWYLYRDGRWVETKRSTLRPQAQSVLPPRYRTARREHAILDHLEGRLQKPRETLASFHRYDEDGAVLLNIANGVLRVTPGDLVLLPHDRAYCFTTQIASSFDYSAASTVFERVVSEAIPDVDDSDLLMLCLANFLLPDSRHETCLVCYGEAGSGKSTIAEGISQALGRDLVRQLSMGQICDPRGYHVPQLHGAAVSIGTELDSLEIADSANFKALVSGEAFEARPIYGEPFTMRTTCKLWFLSNHLPRFRHGSEAELRRMRFIRFQRKPSHRDASLKHAVMQEGNGILTLVVTFLQRLLAYPTIPQGSPASRQASERFAITNDPVGEFLRLHCRLNPAASETKYEVGEAYNEFLNQHGLPEALATSFFKHLYDRHPELGRSRVRIDNGARVPTILGLELIRDVPGGPGGPG